MAKKSYINPEPVIPGRPVESQVGTLYRPTDTRNFDILRKLGGQSLAGVVTTADAYVSRPAAGNLGFQFFPSDSFYLQRDNGAKWESWGPIFPLTEPQFTDFAWFNQTSAAVTAIADATHGGVSIFAPRQASGTEQPRVLDQAIPTAPYTVTLGFSALGYPENYWATGIILRDSGGGNVVEWKVGFTTDPPAPGVDLSAVKCTGLAFNSLYVTLNATGFHDVVRFLQIVDDGTSRFFNMSCDGHRFQTIFSVGRTDWITPDRIGFFANSINANHDASIQAYHWKVA